MSRTTRLSNPDQIPARPEDRLDEMFSDFVPVGQVR